MRKVLIVDDRVDRKKQHLSLEEIAELHKMERDGFLVLKVSIAIILISLIMILLLFIDHILSIIISLI